MNEKDTLTIAAMISALSEGRGMPESHLYLAIGCDLNEWNRIKAAMMTSELIREEFHFVTLTPNGRTLAARLNETIFAQAVTA